MLRRLDDAELAGAVRVQYLGGGHFPIYSIVALRAVGGPRPELFFGFEELDLGLRLEDRGYLLCGAGELWAARRAELGRTGTSSRRAASGRVQTPWRRYYSVRNLVWITRTHAGVVSALVCTIRSGLGGAVRDGLAKRSLLAMGPALRGAYHGWIGRLGITTPVT
jgi:hypothetical protein